MSTNLDGFKNALPGVPLVESPFFKQLIALSGFDEETSRIATELFHKGYAVIDFPETDFDALAQSVKEDLFGKFDFDYWRSVGRQTGISLRIQDAWKASEAVRRIACNKKILDLLSCLYGRTAWPFQTLNFPVGTQQHFHTDSMHFSSVPERFMCGVWVALEDITDDNGPLMYFPGSHKWPIYTNEHLGRCVNEMAKPPTQTMYEPMWRALVDAYDAKPERFLAKKGQALIWLANLMHGGMPHLAKEQTRWSQVTHYFFDDCAYFTPMHSDPFYGYIDFREITNILTGEVVPQRYAGKLISSRFVGSSNPKAKNWDGVFDGKQYLLANPDVAAAGANPAEHYLNHGLSERRKIRP